MGGAPPYFEGIAPIDIDSLEVQSVGPDGQDVRAYPIEGGLMPYETAAGDFGAWYVTSVESDMYSSSPGWTLCRFHLTPRVGATADLVYCDAADDPFLMRDGGRILYRYHWSVGSDGILSEAIAQLNPDDVTRVADYGFGVTRVFDPEGPSFSWNGEDIDGVAVWTSGDSIDAGPHLDAYLEGFAATWDLPALADS